MKNKKKKRGGLIALGIIILILLLLAGAVFFAANHYLNKINKVGNEPIETVAPDLEDFETDEGVEFDEEILPEDVNWEELEPLMDDELINLLLVGQDRRAGQGRQRSDSMIVCSINPETMEISLVSFLRDLYVDFPGDYSDNRLNAAYAFGGFPLLTETLYLNFGVTIDGCFEVDFGGFTEIIDTVGGVDITLTEAEANLIEGTSAGLNHLTGEQALTYSRIRYIDSDFNRTGRQRNVITAVFNKIKGQSATQLLDLMNVVLPCITTDMSNTQIMSLAMNLAPKLGGVELESYYVPPRDSYQSAMIRGMAVLVPDRAKIREYLKYEYLPLHAEREE